MKIKILVSLIFVILFSVFHSLTSADQGQKETADRTFKHLVQPSQEVPSKEPKYGSASDIPEWLKRTSYSVTIETDQTPRYYLETVQPLFQSSDKENTIFTHLRASMQNERGTYSLGFGYRRLLFDDKLSMLGLQLNF